MDLDLLPSPSLPPSLPDPKTFVLGTAIDVLCTLLLFVQLISSHRHRHASCKSPVWQTQIPKRMAPPNFPLQCHVLLVLSWHYYFSVIAGSSHSVLVDTSRPRCIIMDILSGLSRLRIHFDARKSASQTPHTLHSEWHCHRVQGSQEGVYA